MRWVLERVSGGVRKRPASLRVSSRRVMSMGARPSSWSSVREVRRSQRPSVRGRARKVRRGGGAGVGVVGGVEGRGQRVCLLVLWGGGVGPPREGGSATGVLWA